MNTVERIKQLCKEQRIPISKLEKDLEFGNGYIGQLKKGVVRGDRLYKIANYLGVTADYLAGENSQKNYVPGITEDVAEFAVLGEVAAGYDHIVNEDWTGEKIDIPLRYLHGRPASDYFVLRVCGDSMYPLYIEGDVVLVLRQNTLNRSGQIGVVVYDDEKATLKKIEYVKGKDWMKLIPVNPLYPPVMINGEALEHCRILGFPCLLIRKIDE